MKKQINLMLTLVFTMALMISFASAVVDGGSNADIEGPIENDSEVSIQGDVESGTEIKGGSSEAKGEMRIMASSGNGKNQKMNVRFGENEQGQTTLSGERFSAKTDLDLEVGPNTSKNESGEGQGNALKAKLSNGKNARVKVMPDQAADKALEQIRMNVCSEENDCSIELKEVGSENETRIAYEVKAKKNARVFGIFKSKMDVSTEVDAETGETTKTKKPWWSFLASEQKSEVRTNTEANA